MVLPTFLAPLWLFKTKQYVAHVYELASRLLPVLLYPVLFSILRVCVCAYKSYRKGRLIQQCQSSWGWSHVSWLACTWSGEARHTERWGENEVSDITKGVCAHAYCVCVSVFVRDRSQRESVCVKRMCVICTVHVGPRVCEWSCFLCMTIYCMHSIVCVLTYVFVHSHMTCVCASALNISSVLLSNYIHNSNLNVQGPWWMCHPSVTCS